MRTPTEIAEALQVIKDVCDEYYCNCEACPIRGTSSDCGLDEAPTEWEINNPNEWKAF